MRIIPVKAKSKEVFKEMVRQDMPLIRGTSIHGESEVVVYSEGETIKYVHVKESDAEKGLREQPTQADCVYPPYATEGV